MIKSNDLKQRYWFIIPREEERPPLDVDSTFDTLDELAELVRIDPKNKKGIQAREPHPFSRGYYWLSCWHPPDVFDADEREWLSDAQVWAAARAHRQTNA